MAKNLYSLQLLRNGTAYASKADAKAALTSASAITEVTNNDGVAVLARYLYESGTTKQVRTLVGFYANASDVTGTDGHKSYMTIVDVEGSADDVKALEQKIDAILGDGVSSGDGKTVSDQLEALSGNSESSSADTSVNGAKKYTDGKLDELDASSVSGASKVVIDVTQNNGQITASAANLTGVKLDGYEEGTDADIAATDTLGQALGKLQAQINAMDLSVVSGDGEVITAVSEADGKVSASKTAIKDVKLTGYEKTSANGAIAATDDIEDALSKLENKAAAITIDNADGSINVTSATSGTDINVNIKSGEHVLAKDGNAGLYTNIAISAVTGTELSNLGTNVAEAYKLVGTDGTKLGEFIKIYKDSSLVNLYLGHVDDLLSGTTSQSQESESSVVVPGSGSEALVWIVQLADGNYKLAAVDVESFLQESEFASGVTADSATHIVHGVVDSTSEKDSQTTPAAFLTVGADGFKISGIKDEIARQIGKLDATGGTQTVAAGKHVAVEVAEADGLITSVTVVEDNIADADDLAALSAKTVTGIESTNGSITATPSNANDGTITYNIETDASKIKMSGFTSNDVLSGITSSSSITEAFGEVDKVITENEQVTSAALNDLDQRISALTSGSSEALNAEIAERRRIEGQSASAYTANSGKRYISAATNMNAADVALNDALVTVADNYVSGATMNGKAVTKSGNTLQFALEAGSTASSVNNAIHVETNNSTGAITLTLGTLDCGTYD